MTPLRVRTVLPALLVSLSSAAHAQVQYQATDLGTLGGNTGASALNDAGVAAGWSGVPGAGGTQVPHPVLYSGGTLTNVGLPPWPVMNASFDAINNSGQAAGTLRHRAADVPADARARTGRRAARDRRGARAARTARAAAEVIGFQPATTAAPNPRPHSGQPLGVARRS